VIVRRHRADDYEAIRHIYAAAFTRPENPERVPLEVGLFEALWEAGDAIPGLSFTALKEVGAVGHVTASRATVDTDAVVAVGPIGVLPEYQGLGIGSAWWTRFSPLPMPPACQCSSCWARRNTTSASGSFRPGNWA